VDDLVLVEIHQRGDNLRQVVLNFHFSESLPTLEELVEGLVGADLKQDVHILMILEDVLELDDVLLGQRLVDLYLSDELNGAGSTFCLARERFSVLLAMILAAETRLVSRLVTS
jgi:hypothetical protein